VRALQSSLEAAVMLLWNTITVLSLLVGISFQVCCSPGGGVPVAEALSSSSSFSWRTVSHASSHRYSDLPIQHRPFGTATVDYSTANEYVREHYNIPDYFGLSDGLEDGGTGIGAVAPATTCRRLEHVFDGRRGILTEDDGGERDGDVGNHNNGSRCTTGTTIRPAILDDCGFQLFHAPTSVRNFHDMDDVRRHYVRELKESLIPRALGVGNEDEIESITLWHPVLRGEDLAQEPRSDVDGRPSTGPVASQVHIDTDVGAYGWKRIVDLVNRNRVDSAARPGAEDCGGGCSGSPTTTATTTKTTPFTHNTKAGLMDDPATAADELGLRVVLLNVWRPLVHVTRAPLGILATRYDPALPPGGAFFPLAAPDTSTPTGSRWYIFSDMQPDECLVFKQFDRRSDKVSDLWHCALPDFTPTSEQGRDDDDPADSSAGPPPTNQPRRSFDIKAMVILKERVPSHLDRFRVARRPELTLEESEALCNSRGGRVGIRRATS
jgi:hypothetical protein